MQIKTLGVEETSFLHLYDANEELLYEADAEGKPDTSKPVGITLYSPGTKTYAQAQAAKQNRLVDRLKRKGKSDMTAAATVEENARFLADCTKSMQYIQVDDLSGDALFAAVYSDLSLGFLVDQVVKFIGAWGNFTSGSTKT